jgi:methyl-accepting chemotaxis protein
MAQSLLISVGTLIRQITNATHEQAIGIAQVNEALTQLDTVTQQNAALARPVQVYHLP